LLFICSFRKAAHIYARYDGLLFLNLGLNDRSVIWPVLYGPLMSVFAYDSYRRFITRCSQIVFRPRKLPKVQFESILEKLKKKKGVQIRQKELAWGHD